MAVAGQQKQDIISNYKTHAADTGSSEVQIALLTKRIQELIEHFQKHAKDHGSRRGLLKLVSKRRHLLEYLKRTSKTRYQDLVKKLGLRK